MIEEVNIVFGFVHVIDILKIPKKFQKTIINKKINVFN